MPKSLIMKPAPCRNRTYNPVIKSYLASAEPRLGGDSSALPAGTRKENQCHSWRIYRSGPGVGSLSPQTTGSYVTALRKIVSDIFAISPPAGTSKYDYFHGGNAAWQTKVDAVRLAKLTPDKIQGWKVNFINRAGTDPLGVRRARNSVNSFLRRAKSLFGPKLTTHIKDIELPNPLPFDGVKFEPRQSNKYYSSIDPVKLIAVAKKEPSKKYPESFKIFLLGLFAGLRRHEIDLLPWTAFNWEEQSIRIAPTKFFQPKSEDSIGVIPLEAELLAIFRGYYANVKASL
jgi:hypothetical protein